MTWRCGPCGTFNGIRYRRRADGTRRVVHPGKKCKSCGQLRPEETKAA